MAAPPVPLQQLRDRCVRAFSHLSQRISLTSTGSNGIIASNDDAEDAAHYAAATSSAEYADTWGFSWLPSLEEFLEPGASGSKPYNAVLAQDRNLYNPAAVELMAQRYGLDPYASLVRTRDGLGDWDYLSIRTQQDAAWANEKVRKGVVLAKEKRYREAIKYYSSALSIAPSHVDALVARGAAYANEGSVQRAIQDFEQALLEDPTCTNAAEYLAATKRKRGFTSGARPHTPQKEVTRQPEAKAEVENGSERKAEQPELSATDRLRMLIEEDESRRKHRKDRDKSRRSEGDAVSESSQSHKKKKKKKDKEKHKSKKQKKKKQKKSKSDSPSDSSSDDSDDNEEVHPILQRQRHKLWG